MVRSRFGRAQGAGLHSSTSSQSPRFTGAINVVPFAIIALVLLGASSTGWSQTFRLEASSESVLFDPTSGLASFGADVTIEELGAGGSPAPTQAFSFGVQHDGSLLTVDAASTAGPIASLGGGSGPDFFGVSLYSNGVTVGCLYAFDLSASVEYPSAASVAQLDYTLTGSLSGSAVTTSTNLNFVSTLGTPPVLNTVVSNVVEFTPILVNGSVELIPDLPPEFSRGDLDQNGNINLVDVIRLLLFLFEGAPEGCEDALDTNDSGSIDLTDAVLMLDYMFSGGPPPATPFGGCGADPTDTDPLGCVSYSTCE